MPYSFVDVYSGRVFWTCIRGVYSGRELGTCAARKLGPKPILPRCVTNSANTKQLPLSTRRQVKADPNRSLPSGITPLWIAICMHNHEASELLMPVSSRSVLSCVESEHGICAGTTPLLVAVAQSNIRGARLLLAAGTMYWFVRASFSCVHLIRASSVHSIHRGCICFVHLIRASASCICFVHQIRASDSCI